ncbi:MAG: hypothetical protein ACO20H_13500 [Bacteriovoracaceae bacterium]
MVKSETEKTLHEKLSDPKASFTKKLRLAAKEGELEYWLNRKDPKNETMDVFRKFLQKAKSINPQWVERKSEAGPNGLLGEKKCFKFEHEVSSFGVRKKYFVKGYFFNEGDLKEVTIQSFREIPNLKLMETNRGYNE